ncbi:MAG: hypothetical protein IJ234_01320 [Clostridia bacterium]|nr:hypothetical protein [Clostridia bacterium]
MDSNGWTAFEEREPEESACLYGWLLIFHVFRGVIAEPWKNRHDTPMFTHWKTIPRRGWIAAKDRKPTHADADIMGCVLARHETEGMRVTGWHQFECNKYLTHWMSTPPPPIDGMEYRKRF